MLRVRVVRGVRLPKPAQPSVWARDMGAGVVPGVCGAMKHDEEGRAPDVLAGYEWKEGVRMDWEFIRPGTECEYDAGVYLVAEAFNWVALDPVTERDVGFDNTDTLAGAKSEAEAALRKHLEKR